VELNWPFPYPVYHPARRVRERELHAGCWGDAAGCGLRCAAWRHYMYATRHWHHTSTRLGFGDSTHQATERRLHLRHELPRQPCTRASRHIASRCTFSGVREHRGGGEAWHLQGLGRHTCGQCAGGVEARWMGGSGVTHGHSHPVIYDPPHPTCAASRRVFLTRFGAGLRLGVEGCEWSRTRVGVGRGTYGSSPPFHLAP
jgi:hypothetical protein